MVGLRFKLAFVIICLLLMHLKKIRQGSFHVYDTNFHILSFNLLYVMIKATQYKGKWVESKAKILHILGMCGRDL
jgi:hypothetical protein